MLALNESPDRNMQRLICLLRGRVVNIAARDCKRECTLCQLLWRANIDAKLIVRMRLWHGLYDHGPHECPQGPQVELVGHQGF